MKKYLLLFVICLSFVSFPILVNAETEGEVKASVSVSAVVPSKVCPQYSSVVSNVTELLADSTQKATITVRIKDCNQNPIKDIPVLITSNRGAVDKVNNVNSVGEIIQTGDGVGSIGNSDVNGFVFFAVYTNVPGEATFSAEAEGLIGIGQIKIKFLSLPFPKNVVITVEVPKIISSDGFITIFKPKDLDINKENLVNMTMELRVPSAVLYFLITIFILNITMFATILFQTIRIKKLQEVEIADLEEEKEVLEKEAKDIEKIAENKK